MNICKKLIDIIWQQPKDDIHTEKVENTAIKIWPVTDWNRTLVGGSYALWTVCNHPHTWSPRDIDIYILCDTKDDLLNVARAYSEILSSKDTSDGTRDVTHCDGPGKYHGKYIFQVLRLGVKPYCYDTDTKDTKDATDAPIHLVGIKSDKWEQSSTQTPTSTSSNRVSELRDKVFTDTDTFGRIAMYGGTQPSESSFTFGPRVWNKLQTKTFTSADFGSFTRMSQAITRGLYLYPERE